jgi:nicotinamidase-related amidase
MPRTISLPTWYYRQFPSDIRLGEEATKGVLGWARRPVDVPLDQMALVLMHFWDVGFPGGPEWSTECPEAPRRLAQEYVGRCVFQFTRTMPPILDAARKAGMTIVHVASSEEYAKKYRGYELACSEVDLDPAPDQPGAIHPESTDMPTMDERFGPGFSSCVDKPYDFPPGIAPEGDELVVVKTHQLNSILRHRQIWHLTYCGFAINWCLWHSPCGMVDMHRLGYTCGCIKQGVVAVESRESVAERRNHEYAMWKTAHMFGFVLDDHDLAEALGTC